MTKSGKSNKNAWQTAGGRIQGASHIKNDIPCQDALRIEQIGQFTVAALSDGHGSASCPFSDEGSKAAVDTVCEIFKSILEGKGNPYETIAGNKDTWLPKQIERHWKNAVKEMY